MSFQSHSCEGVFQSPDSPDQHKLTRVPYARGTLVFSASGRELIAKSGEQQVLDSLQRYSQAALGESALAKSGVRQPLGRKGRDGAVYQLASRSDIVIKEITQPRSPLFGDETYPLHHMEELREIVDSVGCPWLGVPRHYALYKPGADNAPLYLSEQRIEGASAWAILNTPDQVPQEYRRIGPSLITSLPLAENILHHVLQRHGKNFDLEMQDWGPHNILAEPNEAIGPFGYKLWIVDQIAY